jgi:tRNA(Leu) C34 or U34 (ribose-2'-O)-methylase TrmL
MKPFIVHDSEGNILRTGTCAESDLSLQAGIGETVVEGVADDATQRFLNGELISKPEPTNAERAEAAMAQLRSIRQDLLADSDWTQAADSPFTAEQRSEWQMYRQELRDLPEDFAHVTSIDDVVFPDPPL